MSCKKYSYKEKLVRHACDDTNFPINQAFACAWHGLLYAFSTQRNFKIHLCFAILAIVLGFFLQISEASWLVITLCIGGVFSLEAINTAIETVVDLVSPEWNERARIAKDCAAGAVFLGALTSLVVAIIIFLPKIVHLFTS